MNAPELKLDDEAETLDCSRQSRSVWFRKVAAGTAPPAVKIGRSNAWLRHETQAWIAAVAAGATDEQLRTLVAELVQRRRSLPLMVSGRAS